MAITKVTEGVRTLGTEEVLTANIKDGDVTTAKMDIDPTNASNLSSGDVPLAQLGNVDTSGITANKDDIALLGFKVAANGSLARYNLVDQSIDAFEDASGVDASASTNETRDSTNYYWGGTSSSVTASGGTITTDGDYTVHKFTANGNFITDVAQDVRIMLIAGGGSGGVDAGGGGGAGGMIDTGAYNFTVSAATHAAVIGAGGTSVGGESGGNAGADSTFSTLTAKGGGGGGGWSGAGSTGGSGGGGAHGGAPGGDTGFAATQPSQAGDSGTYGYGYAGADGFNSPAVDARAGGGGGAGGVASERTGGTGRESDILIADTDVFYAGGGGGAAMGGSSTPNSPGGGGAGAAGTGNQSGTGGTANTGSGGGGGAGGGGASSGAGGSGLFVLRRETVAKTYLNLTLVSNAQTAQSAPTNGDLVITYTDAIGTAVVNTDIKAYISRDGSAYTSAVTLASQGTTGGHTILTANGVDLSGITSGTSMRGKIETLNQSSSKATRIQAVSLGWS